MCLWDFPQCRHSNRAERHIKACRAQRLKTLETCYIAYIWFSFLHNLTDMNTIYQYEIWKTVSKIDPYLWALHYVVLSVCLAMQRGSILFFQLNLLFLASENERAIYQYVRAELYILNALQAHPDKCTQQHCFTPNICVCCKLVLYLDLSVK